MRKIILLCLVMFLSLSFSVFASSFAKVGDDHRFHFGLGNKKVAFDGDLGEDVDLFGGEIGIASELFEYPYFSFNSAVKFGYYAGQQNINDAQNVNFSNTSFGAGLSLSKEISYINIESGILGIVDYFTVDYSTVEDVMSTGIEPFVFINVDITDYWRSEQEFSLGLKGTYTHFFDTQVDDATTFMGTLGLQF